LFHNIIDLKRLNGHIATKYQEPLDDHERKIILQLLNLDQFSRIFGTSNYI